MNLQTTPADTMVPLPATPPTPQAPLAATAPLAADGAPAPGPAAGTPSALAGDRAISFGHQLQAIFAMRPRSVLDVGVGAGVVTAALRQAGVAVTTLDADPTVDPDIVGHAESIPAEDGTWDVASCCQLLEHRPFSRFGPALRELHRVTTTGLVLSLPDVTRQIELSVRLPRIGIRRLVGRTPFTRDRPMPAARLQTMGHHWEIGYRGTPLSAVTSVMAVTGWRVARTWRVPELPWHRFFDLRHAAGTGSR